MALKGRGNVCTIEAEPYRQFAIAIIIQAKSDLKNAKRKMRSKDEYERQIGRVEMEDCKRFFESQWCGVLLGGINANISGAELYKRLGGR